MATSSAKKKNKTPMSQKLFEGVRNLSLIFTACVAIFL